MLINDIKYKMTLYVETSGGQNYNLYLNDIHCLGTTENKTPMAA